MYGVYTASAINNIICNVSSRIISMAKFFTVSTEEISLDCGKRRSILPLHENKSRIANFVL